MVATLLLRVGLKQKHTYLFSRLIFLKEFKNRTKSDFMSKNQLSCYDVHSGSQEDFIDPHLKVNFSQV